MQFQRGAGLIGRGRPHHHGGGHGQGYVLSLLADAPQSQKELLEKLGVRAGSLSELLGKLENTGFITRTKDEKDSRVVNVTITEEGRTFAAEHARRHEEAADSLFSALDDDEKATLSLLLEKLTEVWKRERGPDDCGHRRHGHHGHGDSGEHHHGHRRGREDQAQESVGGEERHSRGHNHGEGHDEHRHHNYGEGHDGHRHGDSEAIAEYPNGQESLQ
ncbi:MAG: MarR family transcriptional regulator [Clostridiales bacterium]|nr:MarR family transcriptional regulator [Clostridiales bacterium]